MTFAIEHNMTDVSDTLVFCAWCGDVLGEHEYPGRCDQWFCSDLCCRLAEQAWDRGECDPPSDWVDPKESW